MTAMPKEVIQRPETDGFARFGGTGTELSVHWDKNDANGFVQIGLTRHVFSAAPEPRPNDIVSPPTPHHADHSACHECVLAVERNAKLAEERDGRTMAMTVGPGDCPPISEFDPPATVFTVPLTRRQINNMIETLRRARDGAFGKDA
ncbi:hypothetical protein B1R94_02305 [Mycolicibacterium litorale]|nr:hypothetical protein B1R94_02305 [Mycolicibacterium litorale]